MGIGKRESKRVSKSKREIEREGLGIGKRERE